MATTLTCPHCQKALRVGQARDGMQVQCPKCNQVFAVGGDAPAPAQVASAPARAPAGPPPASSKVPRKPPPPPDMVDDGQAVALAGRICPACSRDLPRDAILCNHCGLDLKTGVKLITERERPKLPRLKKQWDGDMLMSTRLILFGAGSAFVLMVTAAAAYAGSYVGAVIFFLFLEPMLALAFGTFNRLYINSDGQGKLFIRLTKHLCFIPFEKKVINPRRFDWLKIEHTGGDSDWMAVFILVVLFFCGLVPALVYFLVCHGRYQVSIGGEGIDAYILYRGYSNDRMRDVADTMHELTELPFN